MHIVTWHCLNGISRDVPEENIDWMAAYFAQILSIYGGFELCTTNNQDGPFPLLRGGHDICGF